MWSRRFAPDAPGRGVYLCGAATHPAGSVIGLNGRNAAMAVLADLASAKARCETGVRDRIGSDRQEAAVAGCSGRRRLVSIRTPGPIVELIVILRR